MMKPMVFVLLVGMAVASLLATSPAASSVEPETVGVGVTGVNAGDIEIWLRLDELARLFVLEMEAAGDRVRESTDRPEVRRAALLLQANASTAMLAASSHPDPWIAFVDSWTLVEQFRLYFVGAQGEKRFGRDVGGFVPGIESVLAGFGSSVSTVADRHELEDLRAQVASWAREHPLVADNFVRRSMVGVLADHLRDRPSGTLASAKRLGRAAEALESRLGLYAEVLPRVLRWQAQLAAEAPELRELASQSVRTLETIEAALRARNEEEIAVMDEIEARVDRQRKAALAEMAQVADEVAARTAEHAIEMVWRRVLQLMTLAFLGALALVWLHARLSRRS